MVKSISFPREVYNDEIRTPLVPAQVPEYLSAGYEVHVEAGIGSNIGYGDDDYADMGANVGNCDDTWAKPLVVKYKAPVEKEHHFFRRGLTLATSFHAEGDRELVSNMCASGMSAYSLEYATTKGGLRPLTITDMEIAGKLAFIQASYLIQNQFGGSGVLLSHMPGLAAPRVLVIGYGNVGGAAARTAASAGCDVVVLGTDPARLRSFQSSVGRNITCYINTPEILEKEIARADLVIGAILIATPDTPPMIEKRHLSVMKQGSMIVDATCSYGDSVGYMPTFHRCSTVEKPVYLVDGILHYKMDRMPGRVSRTASQARSKNIAPYMIELGEVVFNNASNALFDSCRIVANGEICHTYLLDTFGTNIPGEGE